MRWSLAFLLLLATSLRADNFTNGPKGIKSTGFQLPNGGAVNGSGVGIGMVEPGRPGDKDVDLDVDDYNDDVDPLRVFVQTQQVMPPGGDSIENHAMAVASIMVGKATESPTGIDAKIVGVAPAALLSAAAFEFADMPFLLPTIQNIVTLGNPRTWVNAIAHDFRTAAGE